MKKENTFYGIFIGTILGLRLWVYFFPLRKVFVDGILIHHFYIGLLLFLIAYSLQKRYANFTDVLFPLSCGIIADELVYILTGGATVVQYWGNYSFYGMILTSILVFIFRKKIVRTFYK